MDSLPTEMQNEVQQWNLFAEGVQNDTTTLQTVLNFVVGRAEQERRELIETDRGIDPPDWDVDGVCPTEWDEAGEIQMTIDGWWLTLMTKSRRPYYPEDGADRVIDPTVVSLDVSISHESTPSPGSISFYSKLAFVSKIMQRSYKPLPEAFDNLIRDTRRILKDIKERGPCRCSCVPMENVIAGKSEVVGPLPHPKLLGANYCGQGMINAYFGATDWKAEVEPKGVVAGRLGAGSRVL